MIFVEVGTRRGRERYGGEEEGEFASAAGACVGCRGLIVVVLVVVVGRCEGRHDQLYCMSFSIILFILVLLAPLQGHQVYLLYLKNYLRK